MNLETLGMSAGWKWIKSCGFEVTSRINGNKIFLPAAGYCKGLSHCYQGVDGYYWSSTPDDSKNKYACFLGFTGDYARTSSSDRHCGHCVRPVSD